MNNNYLSKDKGRALLDKPLAHGVERLIKHSDGKHYWIKHYRSGYQMCETDWILDENGNAVLRSDTINLLRAQAKL